MNPEIYDELRKKKKLEEKGPSLIIFIFFVTFLRFPFVTKTTGETALKK